MTQDQPQRRKWPARVSEEDTRQLERRLRSALTGAPIGAPVAAPQDFPVVRDIWTELPTIPVDPLRLDRNLVITATRHDPAHAAFDVLRSRLVQALFDNGWKRVGITSPTGGCGKTFTAINLAISLSRFENFRTILLDMDLRRPGLARYLGVRSSNSTGDFLRGKIAPEEYLRKVGHNMMNIRENLAIGLNGQVEPFAAELFQEPGTAEVLHRLQEDLNPDVMLFDLPPALAQDDVIALRQNLDCILMVVGGGSTKARDVREVARRLGEDVPIVGVVLNKGEVDETYTY